MLVLRSRVHSLAIITLITLAACKSTADPEPIASVTGLPAVDSIRVGTTRAFTVQLLDKAGNQLSGRQIAWSSTAPAVASIDANGVVTGVTKGPTTIVAHAGAAAATMSLTVVAAATSVVLAPATSSLAVGLTRQMTVSVSDKDGQAISGRRILFSSSNTSVATVNETGVVIGIAPGTATITAQAQLDQVSGTARVDVIPAP